MTDKNLLNLLIDIRDTSSRYVFSPTKEEYRNEMFSKTLSKAESFHLVQKYGNGCFRIDERGYKVIESNGDLSVLDEKPITVNSQNAHIGNNHGKYSQSSDNSLNVTNPPTADANKIIKSVLIGLFITIIGGLILWYIIEKLN